MDADDGRPDSDCRMTARRSRASRRRSSVTGTAVTLAGATFLRPTAAALSFASTALSLACTTFVASVGIGFSFESGFGTHSSPAMRVPHGRRGLRGLGRGFRHLIMAGAAYVLQSVAFSNKRALA
jgi:hypothetical protein